MAEVSGQPRLSPRSLDVSQAVTDLCGLLQRLAPKVFFLSETKKNKAEMEDSLRDLGDYFGIFVDARGRYRGLALLWNKKTTLSSFPRIVRGDLNEIFFHSEKIGGPPKPQTLLDWLRIGFLDNGLYDLGYLGYDFTWCNFQENGIPVEERLDRFCADTEWSLMFPNVGKNQVNVAEANPFPSLEPNTLRVGLTY
ncbi:hypothetical protein Cgig2_003864 [Carnegiea gigantea]|uniref:Uncharacterized protein n=1 Tax=Carnegiea gigantea TaxID=171969 RepID=A0A9Q1QBZ4_9CARY|nr:hypothetical protein Cgig2_003864 [Carnegiea gigantea]